MMWDGWVEFRARETARGILGSFWLKIEIIDAKLMHEREESDCYFERKWNGGDFNCI